MLVWKRNHGNYQSAILDDVEFSNSDIELKEQTFPEEDDYGYYILPLDHPYDNLYEPLGDMTYVSDRQVDIGGVIYDIPHPTFDRTWTQESGVYDRLQPLDPNNTFTIDDHIYDVPRRLLEEQDAVELTNIPQVIVSPEPAEVDEDTRDLKAVSLKSLPKRTLVVKVPKQLEKRSRSYSSPILSYSDRT